MEKLNDSIKNYFNGFQELEEFKSKSAKEKLFIGLKITSYFTVIIPLLAPSVLAGYHGLCNLKEKVISHLKIEDKEGNKPTNEIAKNETAKKVVKSTGTIFSGSSSSQEKREETVPPEGSSQTVGSYPYTLSSQQQSNNQKVISLSEVTKTSPNSQVKLDLKLQGETAKLVLKWDECFEPVMIIEGKKITTLEPKNFIRFHFCNDDGGVNIFFSVYEALEKFAISGDLSQNFSFEQPLNAKLFGQKTLESPLKLKDFFAFLLKEENIFRKTVSYYETNKDNSLEIIELKRKEYIEAANQTITFLQKLKEQNLI